MKKIGVELWKRIERNQGYAYISDAVADNMSDAQVLEVAQNALIAAKRVVRILENFLHKYGGLTKRAADKCVICGEKAKAHICSSCLDDVLV